MLDYMVLSIPDRLLHVNLTTGETSWMDIPDTWIARFIGGKGIGARYLYDTVSPDVGPLDPENVLMLLVGPLTGYLPDGGRFAAVTKSPLTGLFLDSYAGGTFGPSLRGAYPDTAGIAVTGSTSDTVYLDLREEHPRLETDPSLEGKTTNAVAEEFPDASVLSVGPAGEAGVAFATIAADGGEHHAGRGGAGAVMGHKGLKAVVVERGGPERADPAIAQLQEDTRAAFADSPYGRAYRASGTLESLEFADTLSILPTRGWQKRTFPGADELGADAIEEFAKAREASDTTFPGDYRVQVDEYEAVIRGGTPIALGAGLGLEEFDIVSALGADCDRLGIDVISAGNVVALAILASQAGTLERDIDFGDTVAIRALIQEIGTQSSPLGEILGRGVETAAQTLDRTDAIPTVKAMAVPSFDPRGAPAMALAYATSDRGACHRRSVPATVEAFRNGWTGTQVAQSVAAEQDRRAFDWCLIVDDVTNPMLGPLGARWMDLLGLELSPNEMRRIGTRTWTMTRLFNVREGANRDADQLPPVFEEGPDGIDRESFDRTLDRYYEIREWDSKGRPSERLLDRLDLLDVCDQATPVGDPPLRAPSTTRTGRHI